jgi:hypothetical protein
MPYRARSDTHSSLGSLSDIDIEPPRKKTRVETDSNIQSAKPQDPQFAVSLHISNSPCLKIANGRNSLALLLNSQKTYRATMPGEIRMRPH